jgi:hypothetical protein
VFILQETIHGGAVATHVAVAIAIKLSRHGTLRVYSMMRGSGCGGFLK